MAEGTLSFKVKYDNELLDKLLEKFKVDIPEDEEKRGFSLKISDVGGEIEIEIILKEEGE